MIAFSRLGSIAVSALLLGDANVESVSQPIQNARTFAATGKWLEEPKIMNGRFARAGDDPWQVALVLPGSNGAPRILFCGGSLVASRMVVTAAHCIDRGTPTSALEVVVGATNLAQDGRRLKVAAIHIHPGYVPTSKGNDVAIIELTDDATPLGKVVVLADSGDVDADAPGATVRVTGWGATAPGSSAVRDLRTVDLTLMTNKQCNDPVVHNGAIDATMICAANGRTGMDSCQGDSGGPMTGLVRGMRMQIGIVSWGKSCGSPDKFGVYARLTALPWAHRCVADKSKC